MNDITLNAHNKEEFPPIHTTETDSYFKKIPIIKNYFRLLIKYWWTPPCLLVFQLIIALLTMFLFPASLVENLTFIILLLLFITEIIKWILLTRKKLWLKLFASIIIMVFICVFILPIFSFAALSAPDGYARHHPIPEGVKCNIPLEYQFYDDIHKRNDALSDKQTIDSLNTNEYLQIWDDYQGGIYVYDFYYSALPSGTIFLKCYEVGKNECLSETSLTDGSSVRISATNKFSKLVNRKQFTIYEGDFDEYYAVRVEVWHRDSANCKEVKLIEKIYRMEGWQR